MKASLVHPSVGDCARRLGLALALAGWLGAPMVHGATADPNEIPRSAYSNQNSRPDPFLPVKLKGIGLEAKASVADQGLHLQGILWDPVKPAAIINRQRVVLNETVVLKLNMGECTVKATRIERERVVLKMDTREIELQLEH